MKKKPRQTKAGAAALAEILSFVKRAEAADLPMTVELHHHVPRPRQDNTKPHRTVRTINGVTFITSYTPGKRARTPREKPQPTEGYGIPE